MAKSPTVQPVGLTTIAFAVIVIGYLAFTSTRTFTSPVGTNPTAPLIPETGYGVAFAWVGVWPIAFAARRLPPHRASGMAEPLRIVSTLGCVLNLLHIAVAFHIGHEWSHRRAFEHTERSSGFGWGIWVNYAFALVWGADVVWMWLAFDRYLNRPRWISASVHGFMGFIVFNAAFVFGSGATRWVWLLLFVFVIVLMVKRRWWSTRTNPEE